MPVAAARAQRSCKLQRGLGTAGDSSVALHAEQIAVHALQNFCPERLDRRSTRSSPSTPQPRLRTAVASVPNAHLPPALPLARSRPCRLHAAGDSISLPVVSRSPVLVGETPASSLQNGCSLSHLCLGSLTRQAIWAPLLREGGNGGRLCRSPCTGRPPHGQRNRFLRSSSSRLTPLGERVLSRNSPPTTASLQKLLLLTRRDRRRKMRTS